VQVHGILQAGCECGHGIVGVVAGPVEPRPMCLTNATLRPHRSGNVTAQQEPLNEAKTQLGGRRPFSRHTFRAASANVRPADRGHPPAASPPGASASVRNSGPHAARVRIVSSGVQRTPPGRAAVRCRGPAGSLCPRLVCFRAAATAHAGVKGRPARVCVLGLRWFRRHDQGAHAVVPAR
jgi:hypothetical protein